MPAQTLHGPLARMKMKTFLLSVLLLGCGGPALAAPAVPAAPAAAATNHGDQVIVIYNSRVPDSKALAQYYAQARRVPAAQVMGFDLPDSEEMTRASFRDDLQKPLAKQLSSKKLWSIASHFVPESTNGPAHVEWRVVESKIRYAVLCFGVPLKIAPDTNVKEEGTENLRPEMKRNEAAVDSELALLPMIENKLVLSGPLRNPVYSVTNAPSISPTNGVLIVARLDGPTPSIARSLIDKSLQAETNGLWGRAYFDTRSTKEPGFKLGDDWIGGAGEICRRLGFETIIDTAPGTLPPEFPLSQVAIYMGWYAETVNGPFAAPTVEFMPGAFAYHLHSFSAATLRSTNQQWVGPLLARGATCSMGSVYEPYLSGTPDVSVFAARLVFSGFTFGEAACASQSVLSWQTTVVGDPLYRPFGSNPELLHDQLQLRRDKMLQWSFLRLLNLNLANGKPPADCATLLEDLGLTKESAVLSEKLGDLYAALGKPASSIRMASQALKLDPTPQQRVRLSLALVDRLTAAGKEPEAYDTLQQFLQETPLYPDRLAICKRLWTLAQKLDKKQDAQKYEQEVIRLSPAPTQPPPKQS